MIIKEFPEDFVVEEILDLPVQEGPYFYYLVKKKNWNTLDLVHEIAERLHVKDVGYAGIKDRHAVTSQYISVRKKISFSLQDVTFTFMGTGKQRIYLGSLKGNSFRITIRDLDYKLKATKKVVNYYGEQRFSEKNALVGKQLIKKQFREACNELGLDGERHDYAGALRRLGRERLHFYVHAYQSELWNRLAKRSKKKIVPIVGYLMEGKDYDEILQEEGIQKENFLIRSIPEISSEGGQRERLIAVKDFKTLAFEDDPLHPGKKKQIVSFFLSKGGYATTVLENLR